MKWIKCENTFRDENGFIKYEDVIININQIVDIRITSNDSIKINETNGISIILDGYRKDQVKMIKDRLSKFIIEENDATLLEIPGSLDHMKWKTFLNN